MLAEDYFREGDLKGALEKLKEQIRSRPEETGFRVFFFQLLAVIGEWDRALSQLDVLAEMDAATLPMAHLCRQAIQCERFRTEIFGGQKQPTIFGEPPEWMALLIESLKLTADAKYEQAISLRDQAFEQAETSAGVIEQTPFEWIADADSRLGPVLEIIVNGQYYWAPFERIRAINIEEPEDLRDFVWLPANFTWENGGQIYGLIPARYPGSEHSEDSLIQMGRKTQWQEPADGLFIGTGQKTLATDQADYPLLDIREITISSSEQGE